MGAGAAGPVAFVLVTRAVRSVRSCRFVQQAAKAGMRLYRDCLLIVISKFFTIDVYIAHTMAV